MISYTKKQQSTVETIEEMFKMYNTHGYRRGDSIYAIIIGHQCNLENNFDQTVAEHYDGN